MDTITKMGVEHNFGAAFIWHPLLIVIEEAERPTS